MIENAIQAAERVIGVTFSGTTMKDKALTPEMQDLYTDISRERAQARAAAADGHRADAGASSAHDAGQLEKALAATANAAMRHAKAVAASDRAAALRGRLEFRISEEKWRHLGERQAERHHEGKRQSALHVESQRMQQRAGRNSNGNNTQIDALRTFHTDPQGKEVTTMHYGFKNVM
jgi:hypothetical protein